MSLQVKKISFKGFCLLFSIFVVEGIKMIKIRPFPNEVIFDYSTDLFPDTLLKIYGGFEITSFLKELSKISQDSPEKINISGKKFILYRSMWCFGLVGIYEENYKLYFYIRFNDNPIHDEPSKYFQEEITVQELHELHKIILNEL